MAKFFKQGDVSLRYEDHYSGQGEGFPILLIAPGGMRSEISMWRNAPWDPIEHLSRYYRVIAMDQRNAGLSTGPIEPDHGWHTYTQDQLALLDYLDIEQFHVAGMCIGGPYAFGLIKAAPERCRSAVLFQPIGLHNNRDEFYQMFDTWAELSGQPTATNLAAFRESMFAGDFLFNMSREQVAAVTHPLLILRGDDLYHPAVISEEVAVLASNAQLISNWKQPEEQAAAQARVLKFLESNTPSFG